MLRVEDDAPARLRSLAFELGYVMRRGRQAGQGNLSALLDDIAAGRLRIVAEDEIKAADEIMSGVSVLQERQDALDKRLDELARRYSEAMRFAVGSGTDDARRSTLTKQSSADSLVS